MRIAITGQHGQVATALRLLAARDSNEVVTLARPACDLTAPGSMARAIRAARPAVVVNAAAWTAVDKAETEPDAAFGANAAGAGAVAAAAAAIGAPVIHLSTDYVFDGRKSAPYVEIDPTGPTSVYGASKLQGEQQVTAATWNHAILRVAWLYSPWGTNFLRTMLRLAETRDEIGVVDDQIGNPTSALAVAEGILAVARNLVDDPDDGDLRGVFHMTARGETSWAGFAECIFAGAAAHGLPSARVNRITTADYPTPAARPANSRLASDLIALRHGVELPPWEHSLAETLETMAASRIAEGHLP
jgi:dTDP-4-dehydrorhamnose reductase